MWYQIDWLDANSLERKRRAHIEADNLNDALNKVVVETLLLDIFGSCQVMRIAGPPPDEK